MPTQNYSTPGSFTFAVPAYSSLTVQVYGPGGGGAAGAGYIDSGGTGVPAFGTNGGGGSGNSSFGGVAGGPGGGGIASSLSGGPAQGGAGGAGGGSTNIAGAGAGGGAGGGSAPDIGTPPGGGGGPGGYASFTYSPGQLTVSGSVPVTVGSGGGGGAPATTSDAGTVTEVAGAGTRGSDGLVSISWVAPAPVPSALTAINLAPAGPSFGPAYSGTPALTHPDAYTVLLLHCDGAQGSTTFTDQSGKNHTVTPSGGADVGTATSKFGNAAAEFNGADTCYLALDGSSDFAFGAGDFTIEFWFRLAVLPTVACNLYDGRGALTSNMAPVVQVLNTSGTCNLFVKAGDAQVAAGATALAAGIWYHVIFCRSPSGNSVIGLNGAVDGYGADANNYIAPASAPTIGGSSGAAGRGFNGWIDEIRVSKVLRWSIAFTPPSAPYPPYSFVASPLAPASPYLGPAWPFQAIDANTVLLLHCDGVNGSTTVPDTSGRNHPVTPNGNAKLAVAQARFGSASLNLDGSTSEGLPDLASYLNLDGSSDFAFGTGDFTIDLWMYHTALPNTWVSVLIDTRAAGAAGATTPGIQLSVNTVSYGTPLLTLIVRDGTGANTVVIVGTTPIAINTWYHVAVVRFSGFTGITLNGSQEGASYVDANDYGTGSLPPAVPVIGLGSGLGNPTSGYLDEIRVSKGVARWLGPFSVPNAPYGYLFYGTTLASSSPALGTPGLGGAVGVVGIVTSSPVLGTPALAAFFALVAHDLVTGSPFLGLGFSIGVLRALDLIPASPDVPADPVLHQRPQILGAADLVTAPPDLGRPARLASPPPSYPADMDRHVRRTGGDYAHALIDLLPRGQAWPRDPGSTLIQALTGLAQFYGFVDSRAADLLERESDPRETLELLPDWERAWGLPDPCFKETTTIGERQAMLVMKMTLLGGQSRDFFYSVAEIMGYSIVIEEYSPFMVGISQCGDTSALSQDHVSPRWQIGAPEMRFYWTIHVTNASLNWFRASQGQAGVDPHLRIGLFIDQNCLFERWKPAHTEIVYSYTNLQPGHSMDGTP